MSRVYFVQAIGVGLIKIGYSENLRKRVFDLRNGSPTPIALLAHMPGGRSEEYQLHSHLYAHRHRGEWFRPHELVLAAAKYARDNYDQTLTPEPLERFGKRKMAARYIMERWGLDEETAFEIQRGWNSIYRAIDWRRFDEADALIEDAIRAGVDKGISLEDFNNLLQSGLTIERIGGF